MELKKNTIIKFRVTEKEKKIIAEKAKNSDKSLSEYARFMLTNGEVISISKDERRILGGLANNINQLVKLFHQRKQMPNDLTEKLTLILIHLKNAYRRSS